MRDFISPHEAKGCRGVMIARDIELYQLAYKLAWPHVSEFQKIADPNIALHLHDAIRHQLKRGASEPVFIASEALRGIENLNGSVDNTETILIRTAGRHSRLRRALRFAAGSRGSQNR